MNYYNELYRTREARFNDAVNLKKPDRVPIVFVPDFFMTRQQGLTNKEAIYDIEKAFDAWKKTLLKYDWDMAPLPSFLYPGSVMEDLQIKQYKWPGYNLADHLPYQFVEDEYMTADEYDEFLNNSSDFLAIKYWHRIAGIFEPLSHIPSLISIAGVSDLLGVGMGMASQPAFIEMLDTLKNAAVKVARRNEQFVALKDELAFLGYPPVYGAIARAPFDVISDYLRGMRGAMLDMYRCPDKLLAAMDIITPIQVKNAIIGCKRANCNRVFLPLHRGCGELMSNQQYAKFYWPTLKKVMLDLIDNGLVPCPNFEGEYTDRLKFLAEMPKGKVAGVFEKVDLKKAKEILGDTMCFWGNIPGDLFVTGTPVKIKDYVKKLIYTFGDNGGLILNGSIVGIPAEAKEENVFAVQEAVEEFGIY